MRGCWCALVAIHAQCEQCIEYMAAFAHSILAFGVLMTSTDTKLCSLKLRAKLYRIVAQANGSQY